MRDEFIDAMGGIDDKFICSAGKRLTQEKKIIEFNRRRFAGIAACISILISFGTITYANNMWGVQEWIINWKNDINGDEKVEMMQGIAGASDSAEAKALSEWHTFRMEYDEDRTVYKEYLTNEIVFDACYDAYSVYSEEMIDKLNEILKKYNLELHKRFAYVNYDEIVEILGHDIWVNEVFDKSTIGTLYQEGTFEFYTMTEHEDAGFMEITIRRNVKGYFDENFSYISDPTAYESWIYTTPDGTEISIAYGKDDTLLLLDDEKCFVSVAITGGKNTGLTKAMIESYADTIAFAEIVKVKEIDDAILPVMDRVVGQKEYSTDPNGRLNLDFYKEIATTSKVEIETTADWVCQSYKNGQWEDLSKVIIYPIIIDGSEYKNQEEFLAADKSSWRSEKMISDLEQEDCINMVFDESGIFVGAEKNIVLREHTNEYGYPEIMIGEINIQ